MAPNPQRSYQMCKPNLVKILLIEARTGIGELGARGKSTVNYYIEYRRDIISESSLAKSCSSSLGITEYSNDLVKEIQFTPVAILSPSLKHMYCGESQK